MSSSIENAARLMKEAIETGDLSKVEMALKCIDTPDKIFIEWHIDDVISRANEIKEFRENQIIPTEEQARDILHAMEHRHDCNLGIIWDTVDDYLLELKKENGEQYVRS